MYCMLGRAVYCSRCAFIIVFIFCVHLSDIKKTFMVIKLCYSTEKKKMKKVINIFFCYKPTVILVKCFTQIDSTKHL